MSDHFDPYYEWLGIPAGEQPPNHYRLLGIAPFENNPTVIENAADRLMAQLRTFQAGKHSQDSQRLLNEVAAARICLLSSEKKAAYGARLRKELEEREKASLREAVPAPPPLPTHHPALPPAPPAAPHPEATGASDIDPGLADLFAEIGKKDAPVAQRPAKQVKRPPPVSFRPLGEGPQAAPGVRAVKSRDWLLRLADRCKAAIPPRFRTLGWLVIGGAAAGSVLLGTIFFYIVTNNGTVKIELSDPKAQVEVRVDGDTIEIQGLDKPLRLRVGEHQLTVKGKDIEVVRQPFTLRRGANPPILVELVPTGRLAVPAVDDASAPLHLCVDGQERDVAKAKVGAKGNVWLLAVPTGRHAVRIWRSGFVPLEQEMDFPAGDPKSWTPTWEQAPTGDRGLIAQFYKGRNFDQFIKTRVDRKIQWFPTENAPDPQVPATEFSVRWIGWIKPPIAGHYRFRLLADDAARVWIDGKPLTGDMRGVSEGGVDLDVRSHTVRIEFWQGGGPYAVLLQWACLGGSTYQAAPAEVLFPDREAAEAAKIGSDVLVCRDAKSQPESDDQIDLLKLIDPVRDTVYGQWWFDDTGLISDWWRADSMLQIPFTPPAEYDIEMEVERLAGAAELHVGLVAGGRQFGVSLDAWGSWTVVEMIDGGRLEPRGAYHQGKVIPSDRPVALNFSVRRSKLTVKRDGETIIDWDADYTRCRPNSHWKIPAERFLSLASWGSSFRIKRMKLTPISRQEQTFPGDRAQEPAMALESPRDLPVGQWVDLLPYVDPGRDAVSGAMGPGRRCNTGHPGRLPPDASRSR